MNDNNVKNKRTPRWQTATNKAVEEFMYKGIIWTLGYMVVAALSIVGVGLSVLLYRGLNSLLN